MGIMEKKMETTIVFWGDLIIGIMENEMETTIMVDISTPQLHLKH